MKRQLLSAPESVVCLSVRKLLACPGRQLTEGVIAGPGKLGGRLGHSCLHQHTVEPRSTRIRKHVAGVKFEEEEEEEAGRVRV